MIIRDKEYDAVTIQQMLSQDVIGRNKELNTFIGLLNSAKYNSFIAIDGKWGSGKSVFVKQIEYLNYCDLDAMEGRSTLHTDLNIDVVDKFQNKYLTYYYNAWENDHHNDPLQSLLFNLIGAFYSDAKIKGRAKAISKKAVQSIFVSGVKALTKDIVDLNDISQVETIDDLVKEITTIGERKQAVSKIVDSVLPDDKKLLFIIDELDRCSPDFAVKLLEIVKHYYNDDKIIFVISTNNSQLMHTVKKHYGVEFDGYGYLNKFYDLVFQLPEITTDDYISKQLRIPHDSYWKNITPREVVKYLDFTMRETNRYYSSISLVMNYLGAESHFDNNLESGLTKYVLTPFALGLKISNAETYEQFVKGKGEKIFRDFVSSSETLIHFVSRMNKESEGQRDPVDVATEVYNKIFLAGRLPGNRESYYAVEAHERFKEVINLMNSTGKLDESE